MIVPWNALSLVEAAAEPLISMEDAKAHLGLGEFDDVDDSLNELIAAATNMIEGPDGAGLALVTQTWRASLDGLPSSISIPLTPVQEIVSITYLDTAGDVQTIAPTDYHVDVDRTPALVAFLKRPSDIANVPGCVKLTFTAGYGSADQTPAMARHAVRLLIGSWFKTRENDSEAPLTEVPFGVTRILNQIRRF